MWLVRLLMRIIRVLLYNSAILTFTTSWDDGSVADLKVADLLRVHNMPGTFYIPKEFPHEGAKFNSYERLLNETEIKKLGSDFEIGAHGLTHRLLTELSSEEAQKEIIGSKIWLESVTGNSVSMFCYPNGRENDQTRALVREAGYAGARTTEKLVDTFPSDPFGVG